MSPFIFLREVEQNLVLRVMVVQFQFWDFAIDESHVCFFDTTLRDGDKDLVRIRICGVGGRRGC
jgi:hypothetical protein